MKLYYQNITFTNNTLYSLIRHKKAKKTPKWHNNCPLAPILTVLGLLEGVPLRDGPPGRGEHVRPVPELGPGRVAPQQDLADHVVLPHPVVIEHAHEQRDFLKID